MYPVHLRITIDRKSKYVRIPTPQNISVSDWNYKNKGDNYIKNTHFFAFEINNKIKEYKNKVDEVIKRHYSQNKTITFEAIEQWMSSSEYENFLGNGVIPRTNVLTKGAYGYEKQAMIDDFFYNLPALGRKVGAISFESH